MKEPFKFYKIIMYRHFKIKFLVVFCLVIVSACDMEERSKGDYLKKGIELFDEGEFKASHLEIKNAIKEDPKSSNAYYYLALINEKDKKFKAMRQNLIDAVKYDPNHISAGIKLSKVYLLFNEIDLALLEVDRVIQLSPDNLDGYSIKASLLIRQKKENEALVIIDDILNKNSAHIGAITLKTVLLIKNESYDQALEILNQALEKDGDDVSLQLLKIQINSKLNDIDAVILGYKTLIELKPDNVQIKNTLAKVYIKANKTQEAEDLLRNIVKNNTDSFAAKINLLDFLYLSNRNKAIEEADLLVASSQSDYSTKIKYSKWFVGKNNLDKAKDILNELVQNSSAKTKDRHDAGLLLARLSFVKNNYNESNKYIADILAEDANNVEVRLLKVAIYKVEEKYQDAIKLLEEILWQHPRNDSAMSAMGEINVIQGDVSKAYENYKNALKLNPKNLSALNYIVNKEVSEQHTDYAIELLETTLRYLPSQLSLLTKLVELNSSVGNFDSANKYVEKIRRHRNGALLAQFLNGKVLHKQKKFNEAIVVYRELLEVAPSLNDALIGMVESYSSLGKRDEMESYLDGFIKDNPNNTVAFVLKSKLLSLKKQNSKAVSLLETVLTNNEIDRVKVYIELARLHSILKNEKLEYGAYVDGLAVSPNNSDLLLSLALYYENKKDYANAVKQYEKVLNINSKHNVAKNNLATILLDHFGKPDDVAKAVELVKVFRQSKQPYFLDTYGWAQLKSGKVDTAMEVFKQVIILEPDIPVFRYHLAIAHYELADGMSATSELKQALYLGKNKVFPEKALVEKLLGQINNN